MPFARNDAGDYMVLSDEGWKPAQRAVNPETKEVALFDGKSWIPLTIVEGRRANTEAGTLDNVVRTLARGATFGFADEIAAGGNAAVGAIGDYFRGNGPGFSQRYQENLAAERGRDKAFDQSNPFASAAGQLAGGIVGGFTMPVARPFVGAGMARTAGNAAANGAIGGGISGFGEGEGFGDRLQRAVTGAGIGAAVGPLLTGAFHAGAKTARVIGNALGFTDPDTTAQRLLARALERDAIPGAELERRAGGAVDPQTLMDLGGRNTTALAALTARIPSEAPDQAAALVAARRDARPDRIAAAVDQTLGGGAGDDVARVVQQLTDQRRVAAAPLYEKAFAHPVTIKDARQVQQFVTDPIGQDALQRGLRVIELEHLATGKLFDPAKFGITRSEDTGRWIVDPDILRGGKAPSFRLLDAVKRGFDEIVEGFRNPTTGALQLDQYGRAVNDVRATYRDKLATLNPAYADALKAWSDPSQSLDALRRGQQAFRVDRDKTAAIMGRIADQDRPFVELGAGRAIADMTSDPARAAGASRRLVEDRQMQERLASVLPDEGRRSALVAALRRESDMAKVDRLVDPGAGSQTFPLQAAADDLADAPLLARMLMSARHGGITGAAATGTLAAYRSGQGLRPATADALASMLFGRGPEAIKDAIATLNRRRLADALAQEIAANRMRHVTAGAGAGASLVAN